MMVKRERKKGGKCAKFVFSVVGPWDNITVAYKNDTVL